MLSGAAWAEPVPLTSLRRELEAELEIEKSALFAVKRQCGEASLIPQWSAASDRKRYLVGFGSVVV